MMKNHIKTLVLVLPLVVGCGGRDLEAENNQLRSDLKRLQREHQNAEARIRQMENENEQMIARLRAAGQNIDDLSQARSALETQLQAARQREEQQRARLESLRSMATQFRDMIAAGQLRVRIVRGKMVVELPEGVLFDSGSAELKENGQATLDKVAQVLGQIKNRDLLVAGHTDNVPIRSRRYPSNWELSAARGVVVARFLSDHGVAATRLAAAGYADTQPIGSNETDEGRAQNRRIEIVLMPNLDELPDLSSLESELQKPAE